MKQLKYRVKIKGVTPYMQHRMDDERLADWEVRRGKIIEREHLNTEAEKLAAFHSFIDENGNFYLPSDHIRMSLINAGTFMKSKVGNARKSMANIVAAMFSINPEQIELPKFDTVDVRSAVNKNVKARVIVKRPKWMEWGASFTILVDDDTITKETVESLLDYAGRYVGIGSYRPEHRGQFGRFEVENIERLN
jgi:hypothetical protein